MQKRTQISGIPYWVGVYQEAPDDWVVTGEVRGQTIETVGASEREAMAKWRKEAELRLSKALKT